MNIKETLKNQKLLPVFCLKSEKEAATFAEGVLGAGIKTVEITLRNDYALEGIKFLKKNYPEMTVGAGTVISESLVNIACDANADFLVSPGYSEILVNKATKNNVPFIPGCSTPSEIQNALLNGITIQKFFPGGLPGKLNALKLYASAFSDVSFIPTGEITFNNWSEFFSLNNVLACGGSFMLNKDAIAAGNSKAVTQYISECLGRCVK